MSEIYLVGGAVRDILLEREPHDKDYVVVGSNVEEMLARGFKQVGKDFPVFLDENGEEYALARKERKIGDSHTDFEFIFDPSVTLQEDLLRRDFTCNALAREIGTDEVIDCVGGKRDIHAKLLRAVRPETLLKTL